LLAVSTRSTVACVFGSVLFWALCLGMNVGRHVAETSADLKSMPAAFHVTAETGYWGLPKTADFGLILFGAMRSENDPEDDLSRAVREKGAFQPELAVLTSLLFAGLVLGLAAWELSRTDY